MYSPNINHTADNSINRLGVVNENNGLPRWWSGKKNLPANVEDTGDVCSIPGSGRFPREGNGNPL